MKTDSLPKFSGNSDMRSGRMDCTKSQRVLTDGAGFAKGEADNGRSTSFKQVYKAVSAENAAAEQITEATIEKAAEKLRLLKMLPDNAGNEEDTHDIIVDGIDPQAIDANTVPENIPIVPDAEAANKAGMMVLDALTAISEAVGITIVPEKSTFSLQNIDGDTAAQFSEILFTLKKMIQGFDASRQQGLPVDTPKMSYDGAALDKVTDLLRVSTFKIEYACSVLGISDQIQKGVADKMEQAIPGNLPQAVDPSTLILAQHQSERLFGAMFTKTSVPLTVQHLIEKVNQLTNSKQGDQLKNGAFVVAGNAVSPANDLQQLDSAVYRVLLKIDTMANTGAQNAEAKEGNEKLQIPTIDDALVATADSMEPVKSTDNASEFLAGTLKTGTTMQHPGAQQRIADALVKLTDEPVIQQIMEKMHTTLRADSSEIRIQLRPESLGEVRMRIRMEGDVVVAKIEVQNQQIKEIVERNFSSLKDALAQQNITTSSLEVTINNGSGRHSGQSPDSPWHDQDAAQRQAFTDEQNIPDGTASVEEHSGGGETGKLYGNNSVEYFA